VINVGGLEYKMQHCGRALNMSMCKALNTSLGDLEGKQSMD